MYYGNYMRLFEMGRTEYLRSILNMSYHELERKGLILPVSEAYCRYKAPAHYDDLLEISTSLDGFSRVSIRFHYEIHRPDNQRLVARGFTVHAATDSTGRLIRFPGDFLNRLKVEG